MIRGLVLATCCSFLLFGLETVACADAQQDASRFVSMPVAELLQVLAEADSSDAPTARVTLRSGVGFEGIVRRYDGKQGVCSITDGGGATSVINLADVAAVTVLRAGSAKVALQGGKLYPDSEAPVASFLGLRRHAEESSRRLKTEIKLEVPEGEREQLQCRFAMSQILASLDILLKEIVATEGGAILQRYPRGISIRQSSGATLGIDRSIVDTLALRIDCLQPLNASYEADLATALNEAL